MPIYAYKCSSCGMSKDILRKISDPSLTLCPECGQEALEKQVTAAGFQLKGSGWYVTDFREGGKAAAVPPVSGDKSSDGAAPSDASAKSTETATNAPVASSAASTTSAAASATPAASSAATSTSGAST
jgi:putative FmdB family regulatory protein